VRFEWKLAIGSNSTTLWLQQVVNSRTFWTLPIVSCAV